MTRRSKKWHEPFLEALRELGQVAAACRAAGVGRSLAYLHRQDDPEFAEAWDDAVQSGLDHLEEEAARRAVKGVERPVFHKGQPVGTVKEYSDTLLIFLLKGGRPEKYRDNHKVELGGSVQVNTDNEVLMRRLERIQQKLERQAAKEKAHRAKPRAAKKG